MLPEANPGWGGARPGSGRKPAAEPSQRFSLSRAIACAARRERLDGLEGEISQELNAANDRNAFLSGMLTGGIGASLTVPMSAFAQRDVTVSGTSGATVGRPVREELGLLQWSAVARSGATIIDGLSENLNLVHATSLPDARWTAEAGLIAESDPAFIATGVQPRRIAAAVALSRQLSVSTGGNADRMIANDIGRALGAMLDRTCLYGLGDGIQPRGILHTPGVNDLPAGGGNLWEYLATARHSCIDSDAEPASYGIIFPPSTEEHFNVTPAFPGGGVSTLASLPWGYEVTNEIDDGRLFGGCFAYLVICTWGAGVDLVVDGITRAHQGITRITASLYADVAVRFPAAFFFSEEDTGGQPLARRSTKREQVKVSSSKVAAPAEPEGPFR